MQKRTLFLLTAIFCAPLEMALRPATPVMGIRAKSVPQSSCGFERPMRVALRARATPVTGTELTLEMSARNVGMDGPFEAWIHAPDGTIEPLDGPLRWTPTLPLRETVTWTARIRVLSTTPIDLTAKVRSLEPARVREPSAESYLTLFPFEVKDGVMSASWDQAAQTASTSGRPTVKLPDGTMAVIHSVGVATVGP